MILTKVRFSTIFALCSGHGKSGVAVIRVSGPESGTALQMLTKKQRLPEARKARLTTLFHPCHDQQALDKALTLWFPGPASFTGQDCAEFHVHGGPAVVASVLSALGCISGLRPAQPGEFTRTAFAAGKLDLTQVEGLADLIEAETEQQRIQALQQLEGSLTNHFLDWRQRLIKITAMVEAYIDFADTEDIEDHVMADAEREARSLLADMQQALQQAEVGERLRDGVQVAIIGRPNAGKSTLINLLAKRPVAIVSPLAGTTRDVIEVRLNLGGYPVNVYDTAGLRANSSDPIELEGVERAVKVANQADLVVHLLDASSQSGLAADCHQNLAEFGVTSDARQLQVVNKTDLFADGSLQAMFGHQCEGKIWLSLKTGHGVEELLAQLQHQVQQLCQRGSQSVILSRLRHRQHVQQAIDHVSTFLQHDQDDVVLQAHSLRQAIREMGFLTGHISSEHILDVVFADFCIGK